MKNIDFKQNLLSSFVVFLVALPLALGISVASGAPGVLPGLLGCAVGGIVVGFLGGAPLQVSGPAAGLAVVVLELVDKFGWSTMCLITVCAGILQCVMARCKLHRFFLGISPAVVHGMLAGIGILIALSQIHVLLGHTAYSNALENLKMLPESVTNLGLASTLIGGISFFTIVTISKLPSRYKVLPPSLVGLLIGTLCCSLLGYSIPKVTIPSDIFGEFSLVQFDIPLEVAFFIGIVTVALIASVESLLSAVATDKLAKSKTPADLKQELYGQGFANIISGALGGLPISGVVIRTSANVSAGATNKFSTIFHGVLMILFVFLASPLLNLIPLAALAGLLVHVGLSLVKKQDIIHLKEEGQLHIYLLTTAGIIATDLLFGVGIGIIAAIGTLFFKIGRSSIESTDNTDHTCLEISGIVSFLSNPKA